MSENICCMPMPEEVKEHALIHNEDALIYKHICGREAKYVVGNWLICEKHKKYYTDKKGWKATPLQEDSNGRTARS